MKTLAKLAVMIPALLLCGRAAAQSFDVYGGLLGTPCPARGASGTLGANITATVTQYARTSNVTTLTLLAPVGSNFVINDAVIVSGVSDSTFDTSAGQVTYLASATGNVVTYSNPGADVGPTSSSGTVLLARWYEGKVNSHWYFCTPLGNAFFAVMLDGANPSYIVGAPYSSWTTAFGTKYGTTTPVADYYLNNWAYFTALKLGSYGYNAWAAPISTLMPFTCGANWLTSDHCMPFISWRAIIYTNGQPNHFSQWNRFGYVIEPVKNYYPAYKQSIFSGWMRGFGDAFDSKYYSYILSTLRDTSNLGVGSIWTAPHHDWIIGIAGDEEDHYGGVKGNTNFYAIDARNNIKGAANYDKDDARRDPNWGALTMVSSPVQTAISAANDVGGGGSPTDVVFYDTKFYSKFELANWLQQASDNGPNYASISALNTAWGSNYDTFGSDATAHTRYLCGTGNGANKTFTCILSSTPVTPFSTQVFINGGLVSGEDAYGARQASPGTTGTFRAYTAITGANNGPFNIWAAGTVYPTGSWVIDTNTSVEFQKAASCTSGGSVSWTNTLGHVTSDNGCSWVDVGSAAVSSGTITYSSGAVTITFTTAPEAGATVTVNWLTGGWGAGRGLLDEDGTCPAKVASCWMPTDYYRLTGNFANSTFRADMGNFVYHFFKFTTSQYAAQINAVSPGYLFTPNNGQEYYGLPSQVAALQGEAAGGVSFLETILPLIDPTGIASCFSEPVACTGSDAQARLDAEVSGWGDRPLIALEFMQANNDSNSYNGQPASIDVDFSTRAAEGQYYLTRMENLLTSMGTSTGTYPFVGIDKWALYDGSGGLAAFGVLTNLDDLANGVQNTTTQGMDQYNYPYGCLGGFCETSNFGDYLDFAGKANSLWASPSPPTGLKAVPQ